MNTNTPRPFLKWAGGKAAQMDYLTRTLPRGRRLIDPFVGSGAVFLGTDYESYILGDTNADLISLYRTLRDNTSEVIEAARRLFVPENNNAEAYTALRGRFNVLRHLIGPIETGAIFVYLNRHGFNGLCRYNSRGDFNVPFGRYARPYFPEKEMIAFAAKLRDRRVTLCEQDYYLTLLLSNEGDVVYCDPPFAPRKGAKSNFTAYDGTPFGDIEHRSLALSAKGLARRGIPVVLQNHSEPSINALYRRLGARLAFRRVRRSISCDGTSRNAVSEVVATFAPARNEVRA